MGRGGNKKKVNRIWRWNEEPIKVLDYSVNMGRLVHNTSSFDIIFWKDKITKWFIRMFKILLTDTLLNCVIIYNANWGQPSIYHFKFRVDLIQAVLMECSSGGEKKVQGCHFIDKNVSWLLERHFPESTPDTGKGHANKKMCSVRNTAKGRRLFWCPVCQVGLCVQDCFKIFHTNFSF